MVEVKKERFVIVYQTDNHDLYTKKFKSREKVEKWLDKNQDYKAIVIVVQGKSKITTEDNT